MFVVDLQDLREGPLRWEEEAERPGDVWPDVGAEFLGSLRLRGVAELTAEGDVHVGGRLETEIRLACRRCLAELDRRLSVPLDLWYRTGGAGEAAEGDAVFPLPRDSRRLDLVGALREELLLAVPAFPECEDGCGGLCPGCGAPRDEVECDCTFDEPDPRWDALRALR